MPNTKKSKAPKTQAEKDKIRSRIVTGFQINRNHFFAVWIEASEKGQDLDWMTKQLQKKCATYKDNAELNADGSKKECNKETVRSKMNYYKKRQADLNDEGQNITLPPPVTDQFKTLEQISNEYQARLAKKAARGS